MTTSHGGRNGWRSGERRAETGPVRPGRVEHYLAGTGGLLATILALLAFYPAIRGAVAPLAPLSSTALVAIGVLAWATTWLVLELVWEHRG